MNSELKLILELSKDRKEIPQIDLSNISEDIFFNLLVENQVLFPVLKNLEKSSNLKLKPLMEKIKNFLQKEYLVNSDEKIKWFLDILENLKIKSMMHKYQYFQREQSDIDILVPLEKEKTVIDKLKEEDFIPIAKESFKTAMSKNIKNSKFTIHVHSKIKWESEFIPTNDVWARSKPVNIFEHSLCIPSTEDAILIECAHSIFENRSVRICDLLQFLELTKNQINWDTVVSRLIQYKLSAIGYLYFFAINHLAKDLFQLNPIDQNTLEILKENMSLDEKIFSINPATKEILSKFRQKIPIKFKLSSAAFLFMAYNRKFGTKRFFWSIGVILSAALKHFQSK